MDTWKLPLHDSAAVAHRVPKETMPAEIYVALGGIQTVSLGGAATATAILSLQRWQTVEKVT
jgi:hypothetical protein